jgi:nitrite reductase/ring-hydroxylating ferredoxin subunit
MVWTSALSLERLQRDRQLVAKLGGKQIALFAAGGSIYACNNRCPHEGYPLREGTIDGDCVLTCNWHGWKFDLRTGDNLLQGDRLRTYPTKIVDGTVWVDVTDPPPAERQAEALANLRSAFEDHEYDRMARELARLQKSGGDPIEAVAAAIEWSHDRFPFGMTHAYAAAAGWLALHDHSNDAETRLVCLLEAIGHMAWDCLREPARSFPAAVRRFDRVDFLAAIEIQDEQAAVALLRGALTEGLRFSDLEGSLTSAALRHYADFGHSLIYVLHAGKLVERLGPRVEVPLLLSLVRSLVNASREDLIPEFRRYAAALAAWPRSSVGSGTEAAEMAIFHGRSINDTLAATVEAAGVMPAIELHRALLGANAMNLLHYDTRYQDRADNTVAENIGWLDFTHGLTFANAVRLQCGKFPELWPQGLLQMACFAGRNSAFIDGDAAVETWNPPDRQAFAEECLARIEDHGESDYIHSAHLVKTFLAAEEEIEEAQSDEIERVVMAAVTRYFKVPWKRKHMRRTAHQALDFVALED